MTKRFNHYLGKAGHLAVMSEFLVLGWNVAIPEVDVGDDIFVVQDENGTLRRIQVKTSNATIRSKGYSAQFSIALKNLRLITPIFVHYVFIVRHNNGWTRPVIIRQDFLLDLFENQKLGQGKGDFLILYFTYYKHSIQCSGNDFTGYLNDFSDFPALSH